jgi:hypothetical protein
MRERSHTYVVFMAGSSTVDSWTASWVDSWAAASSVGSWTNC